MKAKNALVQQLEEILRCERQFCLECHQQTAEVEVEHLTELIQQIRSRSLCVSHESEHTDELSSVPVLSQTTTTHSEPEVMIKPTLVIPCRDSSALTDSSCALTSESCTLTSISCAVTSSSCALTDILTSSSGGIITNRPLGTHHLEEASAGHSERTVATRAATVSAAHTGSCNRVEF